LFNSYLHSSSQAVFQSEFVYQQEIKYKNTFCLMIYGFAWILKFHLSGLLGVLLTLSTLVWPFLTIINHLNAIKRKCKTVPL